MGKGGGVGGEENALTTTALCYFHTRTHTRIITALPVMGPTTVTALLKAGLRATTARLYVVMQDVLLTTC